MNKYYLKCARVESSRVRDATGMEQESPRDDCIDSNLVISCVLSMGAGETEPASAPPENIDAQPFLQLG